MRSRRQPGRVLAAIGIVVVTFASAGALRAAPEQAPPKKSGCCSHHKGVCGCQSGRTVCCDGGLSPTCTC